MISIDVGISSCVGKTDAALCTFADSGKSKGYKTRIYYMIMTVISDYHTVSVFVGGDVTKHDH